MMERLWSGNDLGGDLGGDLGEDLGEDQAMALALEGQQAVRSGRRDER